MSSAATTSDTVLVWRMETPTGEGPFDAMDWPTYMEFSYLHDINSDDVRFPTPANDEALTDDPAWALFAAGPGPGIVFGCCAPETLREWFPPHTLPLLEQNDVDLTVWRIPADKVARSDRQAVFYRPDATLIERRPAADLHKPDALPLAA